jgi:hypothetical protein
MSDVLASTTTFHINCAKEVETIYDSYNSYDLLQYTLIQLTALVFKLEDRIKELESERV